MPQVMIRGRDRPHLDAFDASGKLLACFEARHM
jgi:hypothetical protein